MSKKRNKVKKQVQVSPSNLVENKPAKSLAFKMPLKIQLSLLALFIGLAFLLYFVCINFGFVLDDKIVLSENNFTKKGFDGIIQLLSTDSFQGYFGEQKEILQGGRYRPLSLISFAFEHEFFGLKPSVFHFNNIILYGLSVYIAFLCFQSLFKEKIDSFSKLLGSISFLACIVFIVHPIHTEAVANIKGRDEIMAFLFSIWSLYLCIKYYDTSKYKFLLAANLVYFIGLFAKENTITFFAIIPLSLIMFRTWDKKKFLLVTGSIMLTTIIYLAIRIQALGYLTIDNPSTDIMNNPFVGLSTIERLSTIMFTLLTYLKLSFIPIALTHDYYPYHIPIMDLSHWQVWLSILIHLSLVVAIIYFFKKEKQISYSLAFYLIALSIVSNIVVNVGTFMNERFIFTASMGLCILLVALIFKISTYIKIKNNTWTSLAIIAAIVAAYSFKTITRVPAWENELTLNQAAIKVSKNSARANSFTATAYFNRYKETTDRDEKIKLLELARPYAERAIELYPDYYNAHLMLAGIAAEEYKYDRDIVKLLNNFKVSVRKRPDVDYLTTYLKYLNDRGNDIEVLTSFYLDVGTRILYEEEKNYSWAIHYLLLGNQLDGSNQEIRAALVQAYTAFGRKDLADNFR